MRNILINEDYEYLKELINQLKDESKVLTKKLGTYAAHGGAVPFQIPEYQATDDRLRSIVERVGQIQKVISGSKHIDFEDIETKTIGIYSLVIMEDEDNKTRQSFYIIHPELFEKTNAPKDVLLVSPSSIVGEAILGKKEDDLVYIPLAQKTMKFKIISFEKKRL